MTKMEKMQNVGTKNAFTPSLNRKLIHNLGRTRISLNHNKTWTWTP